MSRFLNIPFQVLVGCFLLLGCDFAGEVVDKDVSTTRTISFEASEGTRLAFDVSPDGEWIVFDLLGQLWRVPCEGGEAIAITDAVAETAEDLDPVISPDGAWIAFQSDRPEGRSLWLMPAEGGAAEKLTSRYIEFYAYASPAWSPDGLQIAYAVGDTLAILDVVSGEERNLSIEGLPDSRPTGQWVARAGSPVWLPDGERIAFVNSRGDGRIWEVGAEGGKARQLTDVAAWGPAFSPDGEMLAYFAHDVDGDQQLWVRHLPKGEPVQLTDQKEIVPLRTRWMPDGSEILYTAEGHLWRVAVDGGEPQPISFTAQVTFERQRPANPHVVRFPEPGSMQKAKGFTNVALSPDGNTIAMIALDSLWVFGAHERPQAMAAAPDWESSRGMTWSPDGHKVAWGRLRGEGKHELVAADVHSGEVRTLAILEGSISNPLWSPDGNWIAFVTQRHLRVISPEEEAVAPLEADLDLGQVSISWGTLAWSPDSDALLASELPIHESTALPARAEWIPLEGERQSVEHFPASPVHLHLYPDGRAVYVENNLLWETTFDDMAGLVGNPSPLFSDPAIEARYASDGSILYLSTEGLRLRRPDGSISDIGWPLSIQVAEAPPPLLIRGTRIIDGTGAVPSEPQDLLIRDGRIERIAPAGTLPENDARIINAVGLWAMPGLIDLHAHIWYDGYLPGALYHGVTTIRDVASQRLKTPDHRNMIQAGIRPGPRIVYAAGMFHGGLGHSSLTDQWVSDPESVERGMAIMAAIGAEYIKERSFNDWQGSVNIVRAAHRYGLPVSGHCVHPLPVMAAGMDGREHLGSCSRDSLPREDLLMLMGEADLWAVTTVGWQSWVLKAIEEPGLVDRPDLAPFIDPRTRQWIEASASEEARPREEARLEWISERVARYRNANLTLAAGTDMIPLGVHRELEILVDAGLSPLGAITTATGTAARVLNTNEIGIIEEGRWADLILLDADPLEDIRNTRQIRKVIKGGEVVDREAILEWVREQQ